MPCTRDQQQAIEEAIEDACERFRPAELEVVDLTYTDGCTVIVKGVPVTQRIEFPHAVVQAIVQRDFKVRDFSEKNDDTGLTFAFHIVTVDT